MTGKAISKRLSQTRVWHMVRRFITLSAACYNGQCGRSVHSWFMLVSVRAVVRYKYCQNIGPPLVRNS